MRWITTACVLIALAQAASAAPVFDDQRGQARDTFRDFGGVDTTLGITSGVVNNTAANLVRLDVPDTVGTLLTQPYEPLSASAWKKVYLAYTAAAANDIVLAVYTEAGVYIANVPLVPTAQAGFKAEANLAGFALATYPSLRFAVTLDGVGAPFAPTLDELMVTWAPASQVQIGAVVTRTTLCTEDSFTIDVPVSVSYVQAQGLVVKIDKPVASGNTHPVTGLEVVTVSHATSIASPGRVATTPTLYDGLSVVAGDVFWAFTAPVPSGSSFVLSVTYRVPSGIDNNTRFTTRASADATNATLVASDALRITATSTAVPRVGVGFATLYATNDTIFANQGETISAHVRLENGAGGHCGQTLHDVVLVDDLTNFYGVLDPNGLPDGLPSGISHSGTYVAAGASQAFSGRTVTGPAVVWTVASLAPGAALDLRYSMHLDPASADGLTPSRTVTATSTFDNTTASATRGLTVGLPDEANGGFLIGQRYLGVSEVNGLRDDLAGLVVPSGSAFTYVLVGQNNGLSDLEGVYLVFPIPEGLELIGAYATGGAEIFYTDAPTGTEIPDYVGGELSGNWTDDPADLLLPVRWVAARADLVSSYFGEAGTPKLTLEVDVAESIVGGACTAAEYEGKALFTITSSVPVGPAGQTVAVPYTGAPARDNELVRTAPAQPRIYDFQVGRDVGQRLGAGPIVYTVRVANDGSAIDAIDAGRNAVLTIDVPLVELADGPGHLPLVSLDPRDGQPDLSDLANGKIYVRWPYLAPRSTRDVQLVVDWPAGGINGTIAELRANLVVPDDVCAAQTANGATTTTLVVRPALTVTKSVDLDAATVGSQIVYTIGATNTGDGAATDTVLLDRLPLGLSLVRVIPSSDVGMVYVSNLPPPTLPASYANPAQLTQALVAAHFVPATQAGDGSWTSPIAGAIWIAVDLDDPTLSPPRFKPGSEASIQIVTSVGSLPTQSVINNRAALDAADVTAAVSAAGRTLVSGTPVARITRDVPAIIASGELVTYTVAVVNSGTVPATAFTLAELLPPGVTFVGATFARTAGSSGGAVTPTYDSSTHTINANLGAGVGSLEGGTLTVTVLADSGLQTGAQLTATARATITNPANPAGAIYEASSTMRVSTADLQAGLSLSRLDPLAAETFVATLSVVNAGEHSAANPTVTLRIPADVTYVPGSVQVAGGYAIGEPTITPVIDGTQTIGYDLVWDDLAPTGHPGAPIPGNSTTAFVTVQLAVAGDVDPATDLPLTLTVGTSTGQGGSTANDTATATARVPEADPFVALEAPTAAKPGENVNVVVRYGNQTRQPAGETTIVVALPNDGDADANKFVRATATNGETLYYFVGTPGAELTLPSAPLANGWTTTASPGVTHVAIVAASVPGLSTRTVSLESKLTTTDGVLVSGGTHHPVCAQLTSDADGDPSDNEACKTIDVPGLNLTASLTSTPNGTHPGVVVGGTVTHTATITNTGLAPSFGTYFELDSGTLTRTSTLPTFADFTGVGANGAPIAQRVPLTVVGDRVYLGTLGGEEDPLDYRNVGLSSGGSVTLTFTGTVPGSTTSGTPLVATLTVGTDYSYTYDPGTTDPELATDNVATTSVTAYRPDLFVSMVATDLAGTSNPVARGEEIRWTVTYDNVGDISATDATLTSTIAAGTAFVVGSIADVPAGFVVEYLGPSGWDYRPTGAVGSHDVNVRAVRMSGSDLATPLNPSYSASPAALEAGIVDGNTRFSNGRVAANSDDGDSWLSEVVTNADLAQWTRVTFTDRQGDDPLYVTVLDVGGNPVAGYVDVPLDASGTVDISGIDADTHGSLQFKVSFGGSSPVCDLSAGRGVEIDSGSYKTSYAHEFQNPPEKVTAATHSFRAGPAGISGLYREVGGQWQYIPTSNGSLSTHLACNDEACVRPAFYWDWTGSAWRYERGLYFESPLMHSGSTENAYAMFPWLESYSYEPAWPTPETSFVWSDIDGALAAAAVMPGLDQDPGSGELRLMSPYVIRYTHPTPQVEALPLLTSGVPYDFDGQPYTTADAVFGRQLGGDAVMWTRSAGTWSATPIARPIDATADATVRAAPDRAAACISFPTSTEPVAYLVTPSETTTLGAYTCDKALVGGRYVLRGVDTVVYDADTASSDLLPDATDVTIRDIAGGAGPASRWILGVVDGDAVVWTDEGGAYTRHVVATEPTQILGIDEQGIVYIVDDTGVFVGLVVASDGTSTVVPMTPAGWSPLTEVRQVRKGVFAGRTLGTGTILGIAVVSYDATTTTLDSFFQGGELKPNTTYARSTMGSTIGGGVTIDQNIGNTRPAIWTANGGGPDGWGITVLPTLPGSEMSGDEQRVLGMDKEDPTILVGQIGQRFVSWTKGPSGWTIHLITNNGNYGNGPQGQYYPSQYSASYPIFYTGSGYLYLDAKSSTGVRLLDWTYYQSHPELGMTWASNGDFSPQTDTGVPMFVTGGAINGGQYGPVVLYYEGDTLRAERLPGNGTANHTHSRKPIITGYSFDDDGAYRATVWRRVDGTWTRELIAGPNSYGYFVMDDESIFASALGTNTFLQKRDGVWESFPFGVGFSWSEQRVPILDSGILTNHSANGESNIVWIRPPRPDETQFKLIVLAQSYSSTEGNIARLANNGAYLGDGLVLGTRRVNGVDVMVKWQINDDDTVTETIIDATGTYSWGSDQYLYSATPRKTNSVRTSTSNNFYLWVDGPNGGTIVNTFPADYPGNYQSNISPTPYADMYTYGWWAQGRAYGCWIASGASFAGFSVGYRTGTPPTYSFQTEVLDEGCFNAFEATTTAATVDPDGDLSNDQSSDNIGFEHAELVASLTVSNAVAPVDAAIAYRGTLTNHGPSPATNVIVTFTDPTGTATPTVIPTLAVGASQTFDYTYTIAGGADGTVITGVLEVSSDTTDCDGDNDLVTAATVVSNLPNAWVTLEGPATAAIGAPFALTVHYGNDGAVATTAGTIEIVLPAGLSFVDANDATLVVPALAPGDHFSVPVMVIGGASLAGKTVDSVATIAVVGDVLGGDDIGVAATRFSDTNGALGVAVYANEGTVRSGDQVGFAVLFDNHGEGDALGTSLVVTLPPGTYVPGSSTGTYDAGAHTLTWALGDLAPGTDGAVGFALVGASDLTVDATLSAAITPSATATTTVVVAPGLQVSASVDRVNVGAGVGTGNVEWTVVVHNDSSNTLPVTLADLVPAGTTYVSGSITGPGVTGTAPNLGWVFDLPAGESRVLSFTTTAPTVDTANTPSNGNSAPVNVREVELPNLVTTTDVEWLWVGDEVTVTIAYSNPGDAVTGATLRQFLGDDLDLANAGGGTLVDGALVWSLGDLASGASGTVSFVMQANEVGPFVLERASLTSSGPPQLSNTVLGVAVERCTIDDPCLLDTLVPNVGCVPEEAAPGQVVEDVACGVLNVSIYADEGTVGSGDEVGFAVFFENTATTPIAGANLVVSLPSGTYVPGSSTGTYDAGGHTLTWALGDLPAGTDGGVSFTLSAIEGTSSLTPSATLTATAAQTATAAATPVAVTSGLHISTNVDRVYVGAGSTASEQLWSIIVHNAGAATTVNLVDAVPALTRGTGWFDGPGFEGIADPTAFNNGDPTDLRWTFDLDAGESRTFAFRTYTATGDTVNQPNGGNQTPTFYRDSAHPTIVTSLDETWVEIDQSFTVTINYANPGPALTGATLRQFIGDDFEIVDALGATVADSSLAWSLGNLATGTSGTLSFNLKATVAGPFVLDRAVLTSSDVPQVGNTTFGVAVGPCSNACGSGIVVANEGCSVTPTANVSIVMDATAVGGGTGPIGPAGQVDWNVTFDNYCNFAADNVQVDASIASGSGFVIGSLSGVPAGFEVEYLGVGGLPVTPSGAPGEVDPAISSIRLLGDTLPATTFSASSTALATGTTASTAFDAGRVSVVEGEGIGMWRSELVTPSDLGGWSRVTVTGRDGDDPITVRVLDAAGDVVPGYENVAVDSAGRISLAGLDAAVYPALQFEVNLRATNPTCDLTAGRGVQLDMPYGDMGTNVRTSMGAWLGGSLVDGSLRYPTIWSPNGQGPDGWGATILPGSDTSTTQEVLGFNHDDPTVAVGVSGGNLVSWTKDEGGLWTLHILAPGSASYAQGRASTAAPTARRPGIETDARGYIYYDPTSSSGVRYLNPAASIPGFSYGGYVRMVVMDGELPILILAGSMNNVSGEFALRFDGDNLVAEYLGTYVVHAAADAPVMAGTVYDGVSYRAALYKRVAGSWTTEYLDLGVGHAFGERVLKDDNVLATQYSANWSTAEQVFFQKRAGSWQTFPLGVGSVNTLSQRMMSEDGYLLATIIEGDATKLIALRPPRLDETATKRIDIAVLSDGSGTHAAYQGYLDGGRVLGMRYDGATMVIWQINPDDTITQVTVSNDKYWGSVQDLPPAPTALPAYDNSSRAYLWIPGPGAGTFVAAYPNDYSFPYGQSNVVPTSDAGLLTFETPFQARAYGCWVQSDASFAGFDVSYRSSSATPPSLTYRTQLLDGACNDALDATAVISTTSTDGDHNDDSDGASIAVAVAEVGVSFGTSLATVRVGETVTFQGNVTNAGPQVATNVVVSYAGPGGPQVINVGTLAAGASHAFAHDYVAVGGDDGTTLSGTLSVTTSSIDCTPEDDVATATALVSGECADEETACDGLDDDCNGEIDDVVGADEPCDGDDADACESGTMQCQGNALACVGDTNQVEICNGLDDDCRNGVDDGLGPVPSANVAGACEDNVRVCNGALGYQESGDNHVPAVETCNGIDDNCAGGVDEGLGPVASANVAGACEDNVRVCNGVLGYQESSANYAPQDETCNGIDDDCANGVDNGLGPVASANVTGACAGNVRVCNGALGYQESSANYAPVAEICNGIDDNCANGVDEGLGPVASANVAGACSGNVRVCNGAAGYQESGANYLPQDETCNGVDDDCANGVDDGLGPVASANIAGACAGNVRVCTGVSGYQESGANYAPEAETCDGVDNDCANGVDDGLGPIASDNVAGACSGNVRVCVGAAGYQDSSANYVPEAEDCDGVDNNCNDAVDEGLVATTTACEMVGGCAGETTRTCEEGDWSETACALVEEIDDVCDGVDNDCDTQIDEDFEAAPVACGVDACSVDASTTCIAGEPGDTCDGFWSDIPDTTCGAGGSGLNVAYIIVTDANGDAIGSVRCFQDLAASNTPVACDTESNGRTLKVYTELLCEGVQ